MGRRVHPVLVTLVMLAVVTAVALVYARRTEPPKQVALPEGDEEMEQMAAQRAGGRGGQGMKSGSGRGVPTGGLRDEALGISFGPSRSPQGFSILKMDDSSPLKTMGMKVGDVVTSVNRQIASMRPVLVDAIKALQDEGTPIEVTISRDGAGQTIKWAEKLPAGVVKAKPQKPAPGGG